MLVMSNESGVWKLNGSSGHVEYYRDGSRAAVKFAAMVAAHNHEHYQNEKGIRAAIERGEQDIQWDSIRGFSY